ncbi:hypothetical protein E2C01_011649 [Portunus trituberculatus]|uniref:Reverse transcriptase domain-containing protein n=1 Tax=Portunus trituberculatus TaxID=210409 RepID=A0A5B7DCE8_PORTR|nr:hypothetical protein [Portunus trituberculatus]
MGQVAHLAIQILGETWQQWKACNSLRRHAKKTRLDLEDYSLYTEELAARLKRMNAGVRVGNDKIGVLLYADDVVVMSESGDE